jgi:hypothetical protein
MKKLTEKHEQELRDIVELYGADEVMSEIKRIAATKAGGRPADLVLNIGIIWGHIEFLKLHRVNSKTKKLEAACALLANYLDRYTATARGKSEVTLKNLYKRAPKAADKQPLVALVMRDTYAVLVRELARSPQKVPIPYLIEGTSAGWKFPIFDTDQCGDSADVIVHDAADYKAGLTWIVTPRNN